MEIHGDPRDHINTRSLGEPEHRIRIVFVVCRAAGPEFGILIVYVALLAPLYLA